ncbi:putative DNA-binding transcriptional regulator YafY [Paenibacillus endophyticus]|uniref:Putative DNA-binding transcriptional regulator YafY n=1 Tax=Paenibacillus endophyticus TaxID=1294268 RepID=A0A7W5C696_9BACL|nr:transcriptional regulator [Paenibacillus endophyticus]MBB3151866.1 putative DNA-binding transcriptional regulator YafY [Paenibacillus endophyticus]
MTKADNMLSILWLLRSGKRVTAKQLAEELEIHVRTVYRCIDSLCASGVPIIADSGPNGGYSILSHFADSPLIFDAEEQKGLIHASIFAKEAGYPYSDALARAMDKLKHYANEKQLDHLERHSSGLSVIYPPIDGVYQAYLQTLEEAAGQGRTLEMVYERGKGGQTPSRLFDPYGIVYWKGSWYTVGYCGYRQETRNFRVDRIRSLAETDGSFERPLAFSAKDHLLSSLLLDPAGSAELETVGIKAKEQVLNELCRHWLFGHALVERKPEEAVFRLERSTLQTYVPYFLMPYSTGLQIDSELLVLQMKNASARMLAHYEAMLTEKKSGKGV